jgi:Fic family protein
MMTLRQLAAKPETVPVATSWYLADLGEARGRQELFTKQSPQRLKALREHALIESAVSSNRIEGVVVEPARIRPVIVGKSPLRDRDEEEVRGYRNALNLIHQQGARLAISEKTIRELHRLARGSVGDAGQYKKKSESDIIERYPDGRQRVRFATVPAAKTPAAMAELVNLWNRSGEERWVHAVIALAAFNLDVLCIHPFRDGNGRVSRLLRLLQCYHLGYEVGRYISLERLIEQNKARYYETLEQSSHRWHDGRHDPWPYINYVLFILKEAYKEFEGRVGQVAAPKGAKTELVTNAIAQMTGPFRVGDLQRACPGVGLDMIRKILKSLQSSRRVECLGRGQQAQWRKTGKWGN